MDEAQAVGFVSVEKSFVGFASGFLVRGGSHAAWIGGWLGGCAARWLRARKRASSFGGSGLRTQVLWRRRVV
jgi:hypothetical protein